MSLIADYAHHCAPRPSRRKLMKLVKLVLKAIEIQKLGVQHP